MMPPRVVVATTNPHKAEEIADILHVPGTTFESLPAGLEACEETGDTFEANAVQKALYYAAHTGLPTLADDSGLVVDALDGAPGVYSARWEGETTLYSVKHARMLEILQDVARERRTARFMCVVALAWPDGRVVTAEGRHEGLIADAVDGAGGFGWDPIFYSPEMGGTFGTLSSAAKNQVSHRARALHALIERLARSGAVA
jgi:XTP/dITP diphosphohydrolase